MACPWGVPLIKDALATSPGTPMIGSRFVERDSTTARQESRVWKEGIRPSVGRVDSMFDVDALMKERGVV